MTVVLLHCTHCGHSITIISAEVTTVDEVLLLSSLQSHSINAFNRQQTQLYTHINSNILTIRQWHKLSSYSILYMLHYSTLTSIRFGLKPMPSLVLGRLTLTSVKLVSIVHLMCHFTATRYTHNESKEQADQVCETSPPNVSGRLPMILYNILNLK